MTDFGGSDELRDELAQSLIRAGRVYQDGRTPDEQVAFLWADEQLRDLWRERADAALSVVVRRVAEAKAEALNEVADFLDVRGILWHGDSGVTVMGQPYSGQTGVRLTDWLRARAVASEGNVSRFPTGSEQETL